MEINSVGTNASYDYDIFFIKSTIYSLLGNIEEKVKCLRYCLYINPNDGIAATNLTNSLLKLGCIEKAKMIGKITPEYGKLLHDIKKELGLDEKLEQMDLSEPDKEKDERLLLLYRLLIYGKSCPFGITELLQSWIEPIQQELKDTYDSMNLFRRIKLRFPKRNNCPLPMLFTGIRFCFAGRFDLAEILWKESLEEWPYIPDFSFGLGLVYKEMLQADQSNKFIQISTKNGFDKNDIKNTSIVLLCSCCLERPI